MVTTVPDATVPARRPARRVGGVVGRAGALLIRFVVSVWALVTLTFLMVQLVPGDPVRAALGMSATQENVQRMRDELHLNDPLPVQYWLHLKSTLSGDFGESVIRRIPVSQIIGAGL